MMIRFRLGLVLTVFLYSGTIVLAQNTEIRGFANVDMRYTGKEKNAMFYLGEQDLFITSRITDKITFLGESVFKYSPNSPTSFNVSMERVIINYNFNGNHSLLLGKHHTPFSQWNDKYHHGRVLFPTIDRPLLFRQGLLEVHTTGAALQGLNLGKNKIGYQIMVGNGIGSNDFADDNTFKSVTIDLHAKPKRGMKFGITGYMDKFSNEAKSHHAPTTNDTLHHFDIFQLASGAYFSYFKNKIEVLSEVHLITNNTDSTGLSMNTSAYAFVGYHLSDKVVSYVKVDAVNMDDKELFYQKASNQLYTIGVRYEFSYLAIAKLEFNSSQQKGGMAANGMYFQMAVGF